MRSFVAVLLLLVGCSLVTVEQEPFPAMQIVAKRPAPPPARVVLTPSAIIIHDKIQFKLGSAEILPESHGLLDEVARVFKDNPQIQLVQIEGHTDITGSAAINRKLSKQRAESVRDYLVKAGVEGKRMVALGFGPDRPIADNGTPEGQDKNRRVEFNIVKQGPKKTVVQEE
jgi:outer membrane protein OmpA-like peptidoglycan-associated protein